MTSNHQNPALGISAADCQAVESELQRQHRLLCRRVDRNFIWLMLLQWAVSIALAAWVSPAVWAGAARPMHAHLLLALAYGGLLTLIPIGLIQYAPGMRTTRMTVAITQMLMSSLLIQLCGGRIETHFHIFGSLAFLAFYMDWQLLVAASAVIALDTCLRGIFFPFSVFGTNNVEPWRWMEHFGWLAFCDSFLILGCFTRIRGLREEAQRHVERAHLLRRAHYDSLTGLPNRSYLTEWFADCIRQASRQNSYFSCLYIDIDRFKEVNDSLGHLTGDRFLREIGERIKSRLDDGAFLARFGSDEFVAVILESGPQPHRGEEVSRAILRSLSKPFSTQEEASGTGESVSLPVSIGISAYPRDGADEAELLQHADEAMYRVKRTGRNDYLIYTPQLFADDSERALAEHQLLRGLNQGEFALHYQPIFRTASSMGELPDIIGLEALMRWNDPARGNISPAHFIPLAEETGLILRLGSVALHEACKQASEWRLRGILPGAIAVNVSSLQLAREDFAATVILTLRQHYTPPDAIELEVTESALMHDFGLAERHLRQLRDFGIRVSIDDFGTGYSSLGRLRQLTLDTLKIDRLFIESVDTSDADRTVVEHIIAMAHTLGMSVVAEGVETQSQLETLCNLGCDQIQGYLLAKPMNQEKTEALLIEQYAHMPTSVGVLTAKRS